MDNVIQKWADDQAEMLVIPWLTILEAIFSLFENCDDSSEQINAGMSNRRRSGLLKLRSVSRLTQTMVEDCPELTRWECRKKARSAIDDAFSRPSAERLQAIREIRGEVATNLNEIIAGAAGETS